MTTSAQLVRLAILDQALTHRRYWRASSLPTKERFRRKPKPASSRRDRVLWQLQRLQMSKIMREACAAGGKVVQFKRKGE